MWDKVGMARNAEGLNQAIVEIAALREEFYKDVKVPGTDKGFKPKEKPARVADFLN
jgi:succinate dehydrogenase / fumarate reductase flavoprotein subunit